VKAFVRLSPDVRRTQLLELGVRLFSERTYDGFSMDDVAELAGVSKGLVFHYFPTKRDFYVAALRSAADDMVAVTTSPVGLSPAEQLRAGLEAYLGYARSHAAAYRAVLRGGIGSDPAVAAIAEGVREAMMRRILAAVGAERPAPDVRMAVRGWIGLVEAASLDWLEWDDIPQERVVEMLAAAFQPVLRTAPGGRALLDAPE
jgi:AcrR family transcriptional regulator